MPIRDLLWACPLCGVVEGLKLAGDEERCSVCAAKFSRGTGSNIVAVQADGSTVSRPAAEWADMLPPGPPEPAGKQGSREARVLARFAVGEEAIRRGKLFLGIMERMGPERPGRLRLTAEALVLELEDDGDVRTWALDEVAALQASSRNVQVRPRGQPIVSFSFPDSSARLWEESIAAALRQRWRVLGRGEIVEFQPRIVGR